MLGYLSKFVLQMLPTISATVIGAYIVATWINPKAPSDPAKVAARAQPAAAKVSPAPASPTPAQETAAESAEAKSAQATETAKPVEAAQAPDNIRIIPIVKQPAQVIDGLARAAEAVPAVDEQKGANELARAAIERLRGGSETPRAAAEPAKPAAPSHRPQQARAVPEAPPAVQAAPAVSAPPLPPAVSVAAPRYPQDEPVDEAALAPPDRLTPPGEIPVARHPLNIQASHRVAENPSLADDFLSATKSLFRAITPH